MFLKIRIPPYFGGRRPQVFLFQLFFLRSITLSLSRKIRKSSTTEQIAISKNIDASMKYFFFFNWKYHTYTVGDLRLKISDDSSNCWVGNLTVHIFSNNNAFSINSNKRWKVKNKFNFLKIFNFSILPRQGLAIDNSSVIA